MENPSASALLAAWERGQARSVALRGLLLLEVGHPDRTPDELAALPLGVRNRLLIALRGRLFGEELEGVAACGVCEESLETRLTLAPVPGAGTEVAAPVHAVRIGGHEVSFRLPTTADLLALPDLAAENAAAWLLDRCLVGATVAGLPAAVAAGVTSAMGDLDADAVMELAVTCPHCSSPVVVPFDPAAFLWAEVDQWAWRLLDDVAALASAFGWPERDVLAMSPWRRQAYLELIPA